MNILHDPAAKKFYVVLDGEEAVLRYEARGKVLDFYTVFVPETFRGRGIAGRLAIAAFEYAGQEGCSVIPSCPFLSQEFLPRFEKYAKLVHRPAA